MRCSTFKVVTTPKLMQPDILRDGESQSSKGVSYPSCSTKNHIKQWKHFVLAKRIYQQLEDIWNKNKIPDDMNE